MEHHPRYKISLIIAAVLLTAFSLQVWNVNGQEGTQPAVLSAPSMSAPLGTSFPMTLSGNPGDSYALVLALGPGSPGITLPGPSQVVLPLSGIILASLQSPFIGSILSTNSIGTFTSSGQEVVTFTLPNTPGLLSLTGLDLYASFFTFSPASGAALDASNLIRFTIDPPLSSSPLGNSCSAWPFGPAQGVAIAEELNLAFYGQGGVLSVVDTLSSTLLSEALHTEGVVENLYFDQATRRL